LSQRENAVSADMARPRCAPLVTFGACVRCAAENAEPQICRDWPYCCLLAVTVDGDRHDYPDHVDFYLTGNVARA